MASALPAQGFDAFDLIPDPAILLAEDGSMLRANPAFRSVFRHWVGPQRPPWGRVQPPPFINGLRRFEARAPDGRQYEWVERQFPDGARFALARDISLHVSAAEDALRAKTTLFATLTHELRTPLNGILGMAGLLAMGKLEPNERSYLDAIRQSGELLLDLITEILDYSRLETGRIALETAPFDPEAAMQDVAELLSPRARARGLDIAVVVRADAPAKVVGDDGRVRQILFNLAGNAVKFTDRGGVLIEMAERPGGKLRFSVRDTGPGVPLEKQALIFEEFVQADAGVARVHGGAGLGLAIVKKLAAAMGGEVGVESKPGLGATFWVELPLRKTGSDVRIERPLLGVRLSMLSTSSIVMQWFRGFAASTGAIVAAPGEEADVALVDWRDDFGAEEIVEVKRRSAAQIALIPQEERAVISRCRALGLDHYMLKPVRRRSLVERVRIALDMSEAPVGRAAPLEDANIAARPLQDLRVLLAEDNPINALLAKTLLVRAGAEVTTAEDGDEAVAAAAAAPYDLIFLDLRMPRVDGFKAAERIRAAAGPSSSAPIVALTADTGDAERARALLAGMDDFLTKPIDAQLLLDIAARFTRGSKAASFDGD